MLVFSRPFPSRPFAPWDRLFADTCFFAFVMLFLLAADLEEQAKLDYCGELMLQNMKHFIRALEPVCTPCGISPTQFQQWMDGVDWGESRDPVIASHTIHLFEADVFGF